MMSGFKAALVGLVAALALPGSAMALGSQAFTSNPWTLVEYRASRQIAHAPTLRTIGSLRFNCIGRNREPGVSLDMPSRPLFGFDLVFDVDGVAASVPIRHLDPTGDLTPLLMVSKDASAVRRLVELLASRGPETRVTVSSGLTTYGAFTLRGARVALRQGMRECLRLS